MNCLNGRHRSRDCKSRGRCRECSRRHHTLIHGHTSDQSTDPKPAQNVDKPTATNALCAYNKKLIAFPIVTVKIKSADREITTLAVLDQCSDVTLCTTQLLQTLGIKGKRLPFTVDTVNGRHVDHDSRTVDLLITSTDSSASFNISGVKSVPQLPINTSSMASTDSIINFAHLSGIALPPSQYTNVDLLIGSNAPDCFIIHDQRTGKPGEPYAQRYPLGWAIIGPLHCVHSTTGTGASASQVNLLKQVSNEELSTQLAQFWRYDFPVSVASNKVS